MNIIGRIDQFITDRFKLNYDQANSLETLESINEGISYKGTNVRILMMAIVICSVGLNMNSTAVVIGAMLLSPLMGPIIGFGVGMARYDLEMIIKSGRNLLIAVIVSVVIATIYFTISPLTSPTSEIIARTSPTTRDVIIAICGGVAGIVAITRKEKSLTAIPGVAIATALMPPLCTAGFGIANGMREFALRALYLFCINSVFIAGATFVMSQYLHFPKKNYGATDATIPLKVKWSIITISILTLIPSVLGAVDIVHQNIVNSNINRFIAQEITTQGAQVISKNTNINAQKISLWIIGDSVNPDMVNTLESQLQHYQLGDFELHVNQGLPSEAEITNQINTIEQLAQSIQQMQSLYDTQQNQLIHVQKSLDRQSKLSVTVNQLYREINVVYPQVQSIVATKVVDSTVQDNTLEDVEVTMTSSGIVISGTQSTSGLQIFDIRTGVGSGDALVSLIHRYLLIIYSDGTLTPGEQQTIEERLQTRVGDETIIQVMWEE